MPTLALIGLGSNLGDRKATLDAALAALASTPGVTLRAASRYHETAPIGGPAGQGEFLNAAASLEVTLGPRALHTRLREIESEAGRIRTARWAERTLDLDLLLYGDRIVEQADLVVPHPRFSVRRFVLAPLSEVAPQAVDPQTGRTIEDLLGNLDRRPTYVALCEGRGRETAVRGPTALHQAIRFRRPDWAVSDHHPECDLLRQSFPSRPMGLRSLMRTMMEFLGRPLRVRTRIDLPGDPTRGAGPDAPSPGGCGADFEARGDCLITGYWFDEIFLRFDRWLRVPEERRQLRDEFLGIRSSLYAPTFVAMTAGAALEIGDALARSRAEGPIGSDTPILRLGADGAASDAAEVLSASEASRG